MKTKVEYYRQLTMLKIDQRVSRTVDVLVARNVFIRDMEALVESNLSQKIIMTISQKLGFGLPRYRIESGIRRAMRELYKG